VLGSHRRTSTCGGPTLGATADARGVLACTMDVTPNLVPTDRRRDDDATQPKLSGRSCLQRSGVASDCARATVAAWPQQMGLSRQGLRNAPPDSTGRWSRGLSSSLRMKSVRERGGAVRPNSTTAAAGKEGLDFVSQTLWNHPCGGCEGTSLREQIERSGGVVDRNGRAVHRIERRGGVVFERGFPNAVVGAPVIVDF
jgi:hypothetical protein